MTSWEEEGLVREEGEEEEKEEEEEGREGGELKMAPLGSLWLETLM